MDNFNAGKAFGNYGITANGLRPQGEAILDFSGFPEPDKIKSFNIGVVTDTTFTLIRNANLLTNLEDLGTRVALQLISYGLTEFVINNLFEQLPPTLKTVTIDVSSNPGSSNCDTTIATNKGYTVLV